MMNSVWRREHWILGAATVGLLFGLVSPWYQLPPDLLSYFNTNLSIVAFWKIGVLLLIAVSFVIGFQGKSAIQRRLIGCSLAIVLVFPYVITTWCPKITFVAANYHQQARLITDHAQRHFPDVQAQWKQTIKLDVAEPPLSTFTFAIANTHLFQLAAIDRWLMDGFGYRNSFFVLLGKGWGITLISLVALLFGHYVYADEPLQGLLGDLRWFLPSSGICLGLLVLQLVSVNVLNRQMEIQFAQGDYEQVLRSSPVLAHWYPPLRGDTAFLERWGKASYYANQPNAGLVAVVRGLEHYRMGALTEAEQDFQQALQQDPDRFLVRGYLATTLLNQGVKYFNDEDVLGRVGDRKAVTAASYFTEALAVFPNHLMALYDLMLTETVNGNFDRSATIAHALIALQDYFQQPNSVITAQSYLHLAWREFHQDNSATAWNLYLKAIDSSTWKTKGDDEA